MTGSLYIRAVVDMPHTGTITINAGSNYWSISDESPFEMQERQKVVEKYRNSTRMSKLCTEHAQT